MNEASKMSKMLEDKISEALIKAVQHLSIEIDEEELLKRLRDSKKQYRIGYNDGYNDRDSEIVRCKDCKHATLTSDGKMCKYCAMDTDDFGDQRDVYHDADWFCADGKRE